MTTKLKVLIIDDNPTIQDLYKQRFIEAKFEVLQATNGDLGIELALTKQPVAILLDLMMPVKGGLGVLDVVKTMPQTKAIPVFVLTAYPADEYRDKSLRAGVAGFFSKAETMPGDVVAKVLEALGSK